MFILYPMWVEEIRKREMNKISNYTVSKFIQLNKYLNKNKPYWTSKDFEGISENDEIKILELMKSSTTKYEK